MSIGSKILDEFVSRSRNISCSTFLNMSLLSCPRRSLVTLTQSVIFVRCTVLSPPLTGCTVPVFQIAPAIMTGNTVVCKPSEFTSHTAFKLAEVGSAGIVNHTEYSTVSLAKVR